MWTCPKCNRLFQGTNQSHICVVKDIGELFLDKSDELVLAFDGIYQEVMQWTPQVASATRHAVVFTSKRAWLIIKPMKKTLDVKFYHCDQIPSEWVVKHTFYANKYAHHIRVATEEEVTAPVLDLLRKGFEFSMR